MSEVKGRKRHVVEGEVEVEEIQKSEEGLGLHKQNREESLLTALFSMFKKDKKSGK